MSRRTAVTALTAALTLCLALLVAHPTLRASACVALVAATLAYALVTPASEWRALSRDELARACSRIEDQEASR